MQTIRQFLILTILFLLPCHVLVGADTDMTLVGQWQSFEFGGSDIGTHLKSITFIFRADGTFSISATMTDGGSDPHAGKYKVSADALELAAENKPVQKGTYALIGGILTLHDPSNNSWIKFKRVAAEHTNGRVPK